MATILPELLLIFAALLLLTADLFSQGSRNVLLGIPLLAILAAFLLVASGAGEPQTAFGGRFVRDPVASAFQLIFLLAGALTLLCAEEDKLRERAEFLSLLLFVLAGMMFLAAARDLLLMYVSLELATIPLFLLAAWGRGRRSAEGAVKYLVIGALASAMILYGMGLLYGLTGELSFAGVAAKRPNVPLLWFAGALLTAGVGFKLTLFPFHMWAPDAYEGAPPSVAAFLSVGSKAAGLALAFHFAHLIFAVDPRATALPLAALATATMTIGNLAALVQSNVKRFLAYSSISQAGYLILGFLGAGAPELGAMLFYLFVYVLTNMAAFSLVVLNCRATGSEELSSFRGLSRSNPGLALAMMIALFGLAGIPPLSGFVGKLFLFNVAAQKGLYWLVAVAALNSTVSLYYYLGLVREMYIGERPGRPVLSPGPAWTAGLALATAGSVVCGLLPWFYESFTRQAAAWLLLLKGGA